MAAPEYVPRPPDEVARVYVSPPWRPEPWMPDRPGDLLARQPLGARLGSPGPDQGFALRLARHFEGTLVLTEEEHEADALTGAVLVGLKRASLFGRAPVIHDLTMALTIWGFLVEAPSDLVAFRRPLFEEVSNPHHYEDQRTIVDLVPDTTLRLLVDDVTKRAADDWKSLLAWPAPVPDLIRPIEAQRPPPSAASPDSERPEVASAAALKPVARPSAAAQSTTETRPTKKVVKKKVIKKIVKKKKAKKPAEGDGSLFARPTEAGDKVAEDGPPRSRDLGKDK